MKIKFLKDSPDGQFKKGSTANVNDWRAKYWTRTGVAEEATEKETKSTAKKTSKKSTSKKESKAAANTENKNAAPKTETKDKK